MFPVSIIGMGMGPGDLTARHLEIVREARVLVGGARHLEAFAHLGKETRVIDRRLSDLADFIRERMARDPVAVLASGDPLFFGVGAFLARELGRENVRVYPNVTAVAAAFARMGEPWQEARVVSLHGRNPDRRLLRAVSMPGRAAVFTDAACSPSWLGKWLSEKGRGDVRLRVFEEMGAAGETVSVLTPAEAAAARFAEPNLVVLEVGESPVAAGPDIWVGMPDDRYAHEAGLITKPEVRAVSLCKLQLGPGQVLWDLGAGSGAVGIEGSLLIPGGRVVSVEKHPSRVAQIQENRDRFGIGRMDVVQADLPEGMDDLPIPDRVFVGGGGKSLADILAQAFARLKPGGVMVVNTVLLSSLETAARFFEEMGATHEVCQIQVSRSVPMAGSRRLEAENPVWIVTGTKKVKGERGRKIG